MRQTNSEEIAFNIRFGIGRVSNSWFMALAGNDHARREAAAKYLCEAAIRVFRGPMFFGMDSMPIEQTDVEANIRSAILELGPLTYNATRSSHQGTRREGIETVVERIMERMGAIEILVADPAENIFSDANRKVWG